MSETNVRSEEALTRVLKHFSHVASRDFNEKSVGDRTLLQSLAGKLRKSDMASAREGFALLARLGVKYPESKFASRTAAHETTVLDRILDGKATDTPIPTKEEVLSDLGEIEHTERHG